MLQLNFCVKIPSENLEDISEVTVLKRFVRFFAAAVMLCFFASCSISAATEQMGGQAAAELRTRLDSRVIDGQLYDLWLAATGEDDSVRLIAAWSILRNCVPDGDLIRWSEVNSFDPRSSAPKMFMVVDAIYAAVIALSQTEGGEWLAADLLASFSSASHGRYDFLGVCPRPVADAIEVVVEKTGMSPNWIPRTVMGSLPLARPVDGTVTLTGALNGNMVLLDSLGKPSSMGYYAWDRKNGHFYELRNEKRKTGDRG